MNKDYNKEYTQKIEHIFTDESVSVEDVLRDVYEALTEKGYDPINQMVGYIMSGDPTYITGYKSARSLIMKVERDEIMEVLMANYVENKLSGKG